jgi:hypothetical protein
MVHIDIGGLVRACHAPRRPLNLQQGTPSGCCETYRFAGTRSCQSTATIGAQAHELFFVESGQAFDGAVKARLLPATNRLARDF